MSENIKKREQRLAARDARRLAQRAATLQPVVVYPSKSTNWISVAIGAGGTAVYLTLGAWSYSAATVDDMIGAGILLVLAFLVAVAALMASERYGGFANRSRLFLNLVFAGVMAAISCLLFWWEYAHRPTPAATADEIKKIIQNLPPAAPKADGSRRPAFEANTGGLSMPTERSFRVIFHSHLLDQSLVHLFLCGELKFSTTVLIQMQVSLVCETCHS